MLASSDYTLTETTNDLEWFLYNKQKNVPWLSGMVIGVVI